MRGATARPRRAAARTQPTGALVPDGGAFYIYEELLAWWKARCPLWASALHNLSALDAVGADQRKLLSGGDFAQHSAEILFPERLLSHPRRTLNASAAALFVVPAYLGLSGRAQCGNVTRNTEGLGRFLRGSPWFRRRHGADHMLLSTDFHAAASMRQLGGCRCAGRPSCACRSGLTRQLCYATQTSTDTQAAAIFRSGVPPRHLVATPLVTHPPLEPPTPWHERPTVLFFAGQTHGAGVSYVPRRKLAKFSRFNVSSVVYSTSRWVSEKAGSGAGREARPAS